MGSAEVEEDSQEWVSRRVRVVRGFQALGMFVRWEWVRANDERGMEGGVNEPVPDDFFPAFALDVGLHREGRSPRGE